MNTQPAGGLPKRIAVILVLLSSVLAGVSMPALSGAQDGESPQPIPVSRVQITYANGAFQLTSVHPLRKILPPSDELPLSEEPLSGFWIELLSGDGSVRYRRIMENPLLQAFEGPADPNGTVPVRAEAIRSSALFSLLLPAVAPGDVLVIFSSPLQPRQQGLPAQEIGRITFVPDIG